MKIEIRESISMCPGGAVVLAGEEVVACFANRSDAELFVRAKEVLARRPFEEFCESYVDIPREEFVAKAREAAKETVLNPLLEDFSRKLITQVVEMVPPGGKFAFKGNPAVSVFNESNQTVFVTAFAYRSEKQEVEQEVEPDVVIEQG
jgi:hypothetical protein